MNPRKEYPVNAWFETGVIPKNINKKFDPFFQKMIDGDFRSAENILEKIGGEKILIATLKSLLCRQQGDMMGSIKILENFVKSEEMISLLLALAGDYLIANKLDNADKCVETASRIATDERAKALIENQRGLILWHRGKYEEAGNIFKDILKKAFKMEDSFLECMSRINIGLAHLSMGECGKALKMLNKGLEISKTKGYKKKTGMAELNIALCYVSLGDYKKAKKYFNECIKSSQELDEYSKNRLVADCYTGFGDISMMENKKEEMKEHYEKAMNDIMKNGDMQFLSKACMNLGKMHLQEKDFEKAFEYADKVSETAVKVKSKKHQAEAYVLRGSIYEAQENYNDALKSYGIAMAIFRNLKDKPNIYRTEQILNLIYPKIDIKRAKDKIKG